MGYLHRTLAETPEWFRQLTPAQQLLLGPREGRPSGAVATDGETVWAAAEDPVKRPVGRDQATEMWQWETQRERREGLKSTSHRVHPKEARDHVRPIYPSGSDHIPSRL